MAIGRDTTAANIKPLEGALIDRFTAGAAIAAGELVSMSSDGYIDPADSTSAKSLVLGVAVQAAAAAGERIDVVTHGRVKCLTGATPGAWSTTAPRRANRWRRWRATRPPRVSQCRQRFFSSGLGTKETRT